MGAVRELRIGRGLQGPDVTHLDGTISQETVALAQDLGADTRNARNGVR